MKTRLLPILGILAILAGCANNQTETQNAEEMNNTPLNEVAGR